VTQAVQNERIKYYRSKRRERMRKIDKTFVTSIAKRCKKINSKTVREMSAMFDVFIMVFFSPDQKIKFEKCVLTLSYYIYLDIRVINEQI
jgi:hypothetical protein